MKHYSFMESVNSYIRKTSGMSETEARKLLQNYLISRTGKATFNDAINEYGKRLSLNALDRTDKAAKKYGRHLRTVPSLDFRGAHIAIGGNAKDALKAVPSYVNGSKNAKHVVNLDDVFSVAVSKNNQIVPGYVNQHEADEYLTAMKLAAKENMSPAQIAILARKQYQHMPGVLTKEYNRRKLLDKLGINGLEDLTFTKQDLQRDQIPFDTKELMKKLTPEEKINFDASSSDNQVLRNAIADRIKRWRQKHV